MRVSTQRGWLQVLKERAFHGQLRSRERRLRKASRRTSLVGVRHRFGSALRPDHSSAISMIYQMKGKIAKFQVQFSEGSTSGAEFPVTSIEGRLWRCVGPTIPFDSKISRQFFKHPIPPSSPVGFQNFHLTGNPWPQLPQRRGERLQPQTSRKLDRDKAFSLQRRR